MADEIQTGLGRTGRLFCCDWEDVRPDVLIVGKALGGGVYPVSAVLADAEYMDVFRPGDHGSTFGGNPLGAAVARASLAVILEEELSERSDELGSWFMDELRPIDSPHVEEVRGKGLMIGVVIREASGPRAPSARRSWSGDPGQGDPPPGDPVRASAGDRARSSWRRPRGDRPVLRGEGVRLRA
jgi:ornithine--oxo-acid transaminase